MTVVAPSRTAAREQLDSLVLPTRRDESWRYAPHGDLAKLAFGPATPAAAPADLDARVPQLDGPCVVIVNGVVDAERSTLDSLPDGVRISTLADAPADLGVVLDADAAPADAFAVLNAAWATDGALVRIDGTVDQLIHIVDVCKPGTEVNASASRVVIDVATDSSATVVETRLGDGDAFGGSNVHTSITLAENASLEHIVLQDLPDNQIHLGRIEVVQGEGSNLDAKLFNLGASYGRVVYHVQLAGPGAHAELSGLYFGFGSQTLDQQITVVHAVPDCTSRQSYRGVLDDRSTGVWIGGVDVRPGADGTDSEQSNDNLLLSRQAEINTQPRLEILADEVKCAHGATVGQLDEEALYYMRTRGIPEDQAGKLLVEGFADQVMDDLEHEAVEAWVTERLGHDHA